MALTTSSNILSLSGQRALLTNLSRAQADYTRSAERISSGFRINRASDDPSGNSLVERFTAQINGTEQAGRNVDHAISFVDTAEGDLSTMQGLLQEIRTKILAAQDNNDVLAKLENQAEIAPLLLELERMAQSSEFDGRKMFNTASQNFTYQVGPNAADLVSVQTGDFRISQTGVYRVEGIASSADSKVRNTAAERLTINGAVGSKAVNLASSVSARVTAEQVNAVKQLTGVEALAKTEVDLSTWSAGTYRLTLAGDNTTAINVDVPIEALSGGGLGFDDAVSAINARTVETGIVASLNAAALLSQATGLNDTTAGIILTNDKGNTITIGQPVANTTTGIPSVADSPNPGTKLTLTGAGGPAVTISNVDTVAKFITGQTTFFSDRPFTVIGTQMSDATATATVVAGGYPGMTLKKPTSATQPFASETAALLTLSTLDVTTLDKGKLALFAVDSVLDGINRQRASLGSAHDRFENYILPNVEMDNDNLMAARSNIRDLDARELAVEALNKDLAVNQYTLTLQLLSEASELQKTVLSLLG
jgi:flagellin